MTIHVTRKKIKNSLFSWQHFYLYEVTFIFRPIPKSYFSLNDIKVIPDPEGRCTTQYSRSGSIWALHTNSSDDCGPVHLPSYRFTWRISIKRKTHFPSPQNKHSSAAAVCREEKRNRYSFSFFIPFRLLSL